MVRRIVYYFIENESIIAVLLMSLWNVGVASKTRAIIFISLPVMVSVEIGILIAKLI